MKLISWNVNGLRACMGKGFQQFFDSVDADCFCLQETKLQAGQIRLEPEGYRQYWNYAEKKGYSGTAIFTKQQPLSAAYGLGIPELDTEGRLITLEFPEFYLVTCYTPNAQRGLARIDHRLKWDEAFRDYLCQLDSEKPVIICGDLNAKPDSNVIAAFKKHFKIVSQTKHATWSSDKPQNLIDYIMVLKSSAKGVKAGKAHVVNGTLASDHLPQCVTIGIRR